MYVLLLVLGASSTAQPTRQLHYVDVAHAVHARRPWAAAAGCASIQAEAEAQDAQLQAGPQEQLALLFSRPDGMVALPHVHGLHSQCSPQPHVVCSRCPPAPLPDVHLQSLPPGHGTAHPHLSSHPMPDACCSVAAPVSALLSGSLCRA